MLKKMMWIDLETRSHEDLLSRGLLKYAQHPSTEVICMSYAFDDGDVKTWFAEDGPFPQEVLDHFASGGIGYAHNASFERQLFDYVIANDYDFKAPALEQWRCSAARAMAHGLPHGLDMICRALRLPLQKQSEGKRLIRDYCAPHFKTEWEGNDKQLMQDYCEMDVMTMRQFCSVLRELSDEEWEQYHITERMNDRGVPIDTHFVSAALSYAEDIRKDVASQIVKLTNGEVTKPTERTTRDAWLTSKLTPEQLEIITVEKKEVKKIKFDQEYRALLASDPDLPEEVDKFIDLVEQAGGSTISKYGAMSRTHVDGRVHGSLIWNGAGTTGRFSSRGLQLQNFRRDVFKDPDPIIEAVKQNVVLDKPADALGRLIRSAISSPNGLTFSDYSQIEARVLPWLSGDPRAEATLDVFREGRDIYTETAVGMFNLKSVEQVDSDLRQASKQGNLACGFGGGARAVQAMAKNYGLKYDFDRANGIKVAWRKANPWAEPFWYGLTDAANAAFRRPGTVTRAGKIKFFCNGQDILWMMLPSGRCLAYLKPKFELVMLPWGEEDWRLTCLWGSGKPKAGQKWLRRTLSHLILSENATQGTAADIMREAIVRAYKSGLDVLFSVHDELVAEGHVFDKLHAVMVQQPTWADGLPIDADTQEAYRYGK